MILRRLPRAKALFLCLIASGSITLTTCGISDRQWSQVFQSVITSALTSAASAAVQAAAGNAGGTTP